MKTSSAAQRRYSTLSEHTRSAKDLEYEVFLEVTRELSELRAVALTNFEKLVRVLNKNERLWIEIGTQVADADNALEPSLRARLFYLTEFVRLQTGKVLGGTASVNALIETNIAVLRGLKGNT